MYMWQRCWGLLTCMFATECVLLLQNVSSYYRMCSLTLTGFTDAYVCVRTCRKCSLITECVLLLQNVFSYCGMSSLNAECALLLQNALSYYRMCSLTTECVRLLQNVFSYRHGATMMLPLVVAPPGCTPLAGQNVFS